MARTTRVGVAGIAILGLLFATPPVPSRAASTFTATAGGELARTLLRLQPAIIQEDLLDPGALAAQASLTSFGESQAFASSPYPGALLVSVPGTANGVLAPRLPPGTGGVIHLPEYPLYVASSYPATPSANAHTGPGDLTAESRSDESRAVATDGANRTETTVSVDSDHVLAQASAEVSTVDAGPLLRIDGLRTAVEVSQSPSGQLERSSDFSFASMTILGQQVRWTPDGLELAGTRLPIDSNQATDPPASLLAALAEQGTALRFVPETPTADGMISAAVEISRAVDIPGVGTITAVSTFGRTYAAVSNTARPPLPTGPPVQPATTPPLGSVGPSLPGSGPTGPITASPAPGAGTSTATPASAAGERSISALVAPETDAGRFYPVLVVAAGLVALSSTLFRRLGGRLAWSS